MAALTSPAGAPADQTRRCPGCTTRIPLTEPWCDTCWSRLPFHLSQPVSVAFRRDEHAHQLAVHNARQWLKANPFEAEAEDPRPERSALALQLHDMADMLDGVGRHATHTQRKVGRCVVCDCGTRVQGRLP